MQIQNSQPLLITVTCLSISPRVGGVVRISWTRHAQNSQPLLITVTSPPVTPRASSNTYSYSLCEQRLT